MSNEEKINKYWQYARKELKSFKKYYSKLDKNTQDKIQDIFNSVDINYYQLFNNITTQLKNRLDRKIEESKEKGTYKGYLKYKIETLYKKNINYKSYIEIMLFITLYEEKKNVDEYVNILFSNVATNYYNKGRNDLKKKSKSIIPKVVFSSMLATEINGLIFNDYLEGLYVSKEQQLTKQYINVLQTNKKPNIDSKVFQNTISKLNNQLLSINDDKYSGGLDEYVCSYSNLAYLEAGGTNNHRVIFISDHCENTTKMCEEMDGLIFNTKDRNVFKRWYGDTQKDLIYMEIDVMGLVTGVNLPPISNHFHWCHSILEYLQEEQLSAGANNLESYNKIADENVEYIEHIDICDRKVIDKKLEEYQKEISNKDIEYGYIIDKDGYVFKIRGDNRHFDIPKWLNIENSIGIHNHPNNETNYSFSVLDLNLLLKGKMKEFYGFDNKYYYSIKRTLKTQFDDTNSLKQKWNKYNYEVWDLSDKGKIDVDKESYHYIVKKISKDYNITYERRNV